MKHAKTILVLFTITTLLNSCVVSRKRYKEVESKLEIEKNNISSLKKELEVKTDNIQSLNHSYNNCLKDKTIEQLGFKKIIDSIEFELRIKELEFEGKEKDIKNNNLKEAQNLRQSIDKGIVHLKEEKNSPAIIEGGVKTYGKYEQDYEISYSIGLDTTITGEVSGYSKGKYKTDVSNSAVQLLIDSINEFLIDNEIKSNQIIGQIIGMADGYKISGDINFTENVKSTTIAYASLRNNDYYEHTIKKNDEITSNDLLAYYRAAWAYADKVGSNPILKNADIKIIADTTTLKGSPYRKIEIVLFVRNAPLEFRNKFPDYLEGTVECANNPDCYDVTITTKKPDATLAYIRTWDKDAKMPHKKVMSGNVMSIRVPRGRYFIWTERNGEPSSFSYSRKEPYIYKVPHTKPYHIDEFE